jgi:hypothetical protein
VRAAELPEEDVGQRRALARLRLGVDVEDDRPRRGEFVVVVANDQHDLAAADVDLPNLPLLDEPGQRAEADAVVERPPGIPSVIRHGQIGSQLHDSKYEPLTA